MKEFYFTIHLTENEHNILKEMIHDACVRRDIELSYYRKFKTGHIPMFRECKLYGDEIKINKLVKELELTDHIDNYFSKH